MADTETPIESVLAMIQQGMSDMDIIRKLTETGYSPVQITDALNQAKIKKEISGTEGLQPSIMQQAPPIPVPSPRQAPIPTPTMEMPIPASGQLSITTEYPAYPYQYPTQEAMQPKMETEAIEEIAEEIVNEKWGEIKGKISDVIEWKLYAEKRIVSIDDRIKRMEASMDRLQAALLSKVQEYQRSVKDIGVEMAGLEGAFGKVLTPFVDNMRELSKITGELKSAKIHAKPISKPKKAKTVTTTTTTIVSKPKVHVQHAQVQHAPKKKIVKEVTKVTKTVKK
jgi:hypothetical protein